LKVLVIGLDGATWTLLKTLTDAGDLPFVKKLIDGGVRGDLVSTIPPVTFPAWKCYSTGKNPGKLDVFGWIKPDFERKTIVPNSSVDFKAREIWDYLSKNDILCCSVGMPTTYPPKKINGVLVSEFNPRNTGFVYPTELEEEIRSKLGYRAFFEDFHGKKDILWNTMELIKQRFKLCNFLHLRYNFSFINLTIFFIDNIQHFYWRDEESLKHAWKLIDAEIKNLVETVEPDILFFVSDHGFTTQKAMFNITHWLLLEGYLVLKRKWMNVLAKLGLLPYVSRLGKFLLKKMRIRKEETKEIGRVSYDFIDWEKSKVIPFSEGSLYINPLIVKKSEYRKLKRELMDKLREIRDPRTNESIFKVFTKEEIYSGKYTGNAPDVVLLPREGYEIICGFAKPLWVFKVKQSGWDGIHNLNGIFLAYGKCIKKGVKIERVKIYDVAPTILHIFGLPIPDDIDGRVLMEIFEENSEISKRQPIYVRPSYYDRRNEKELLKSKIRKLKQEGKI